jgi:hypothetical protein
MATTTNYGWATPDDTDLVKDGAAAIRTLGTSIDTSFAADEGDLLVGGTSDIFEALPIGAAGTVLTSDGDTAEWVAPSATTPTFTGVKATQNSAWSLSNGTTTQFAFPNEEFDTDGYHSTVTNNERLTIPTGKGGYYYFWFTLGQETTAGQIEFYLRKNGTNLTRFDSDDAVSYSHNFSTLIEAVAGDFFEVRVFNNTGGNVTQVGETAFGCYLIGV